MTLQRLARCGATLMLDITNKIIIQDIGVESELSTHKYKPMMVLDDEVDANWADYIFSRLLESVNMNHAVKNLNLLKMMLCSTYPLAIC